MLQLLQAASMTLLKAFSNSKQMSISSLILILSEVTDSNPMENDPICIEHDANEWEGLEIITEVIKVSIYTQNRHSN